MRPNRFALLTVILALGITVETQIVSIQNSGHEFKVVGWQAPAAPPSGGWPSVFAVYVDAANVPALLGSYGVERGTLVFRSQYPLSPGVRYRAVFRQPGQRAIEQTFNGPPKSTTPAARVEQVYPSADVLPSNQLRLYIYFSLTGTDHFYS